VAARAVFVDASGRRQRRVRRLGLILVVPAVAYVGLLASTLLGGPTVHTPLLPTPPGRSHHTGTSGGGSAGTGAGDLAGPGAGASSGPGSGTVRATASPSPGLPSPSASPTSPVTASTTPPQHGESTHSAKTSPPAAGHRATPTRKP
jgi:hypothetical protein